jgi:hypothetical protein
VNRDEQLLAKGFLRISNELLPRIAESLEIIAEAITQAQEDQPNYTCPDYADTMGDD